MKPTNKNIKRAMWKQSQKKFLQENMASDEKVSRRQLAEKILFDNMSDYTAKHISEISFLSDWIVDAMIEYNEYMEEGII